MPKASKPIPQEGLAKIKANIRSARRFLSKEGLTATQKQQAQRNIQELESQLAETKARNECTFNEVRYKKIRYTERTKALRRIKALKKEFADSSEDNKFQKKILHARVDLHYVTKYPLDAKYIALFPDGEYVKFSKSDLKSEDPTTKQRQFVRQQMLDDMRAGKLSAEPELEVQKKEKKEKKEQPSRKDKEEAVVEEEEAKQASEAEEPDDFFE